MTDLVGWGSFYVIIGSAAGALIGLQFVVMTLTADRPPSAAAVAAFVTPTIVHFSAALFMSALVCIPWRVIAVPAVLWGLTGLSGALYSLSIIRHIRVQTMYKPGFEDWLVHVHLPLVSYSVLALSALALPAREREALFGIAAAALLLLFIGIHNAWDNIAYHVSVRRRDSEFGGHSK